MISPRPVCAEEQRPEFKNYSLGVTADCGLGLGAAGDSILGQLGGQFVGIRTARERAWLLTWDVRLALEGGVVANTLPYTGLLGAHAAADGELGYRWLHRRQVSPYTGVRLSGDLSVTTRPGTPITELNTLNNMDGVGGVNARGAIRVIVGVSLLGGPRSLLLGGFFQEALRAPGVYTPGATFAEGGITVRFDIARKLTAELEGLAGQSPPSALPALGTSDQTTYAEISALVRKIFSNRMWLSVSASYGREFDERTYQASGTHYSTGSAPTFALHLLYGIPIGSRFNPPRSRP